MISYRNNLKPAHSGYRYQDISTAYFLIKTLIGKYDSVTVDKKQVPDDRFDDLEVRIYNRIYRKQIKYSSNDSRIIERSDFTNKNSTLRIDRLILTYKRSEIDIHEYRLCATWKLPKNEDELFDLLEIVEADKTFDGTTSTILKFIPSKIWPPNKNPIWEVLCKGKRNNEFNRTEFVEFCDKFYIELELPKMSKDLLNPGLLEILLIQVLNENVGIGRYPNIGRQSEDVAALAVCLANLARTQGATLLSEEIAKNLEIRTDFGRVSQAFPLDINLFYNRPDFREKLSLSFQSGGIHIVTGPPGSGKSWELTYLSEKLSKNFIVARHYCYLEPGDELIERRVTTDVFFANIISELYEAEPSLKQDSTRLSADLTTLEEALICIGKLGKAVILIIDGLDHISRVKSNSNLLSDDETDIIERLSTMTIPDGVCIVIGSQPGDHLRSLHLRREHDVTTHELPAWRHEDIIKLSILHGVKDAITNYGINSHEEKNEILDVLAEKSDGNPLYVRYLCQGLISSLNTGTSINPKDWLLASPRIHGDVAIYYKHLYENILSQAQAIADLFGVIDFSITESELNEILPGLISSWLPSALNALSPVLIRISGQGGVRIFHESFRRFMLDELKGQRRSLRDVLSPVIIWLENRGFYEDAKSYRFLLPALRRSGQENDIARLINISFISESVSNGHPIEAIQKNLSIAAEVAGRVRNWPLLVRCAELSRALFTCFDMGQNDWKDFWSTYADIFGADALSERLLFDGKTTLGYEEGLRACLLVDDLGGVAPWKEYLSLTPPEFESSYYADFDHSRNLTDEDSLTIAIIQGRLRLGYGWRILRRFYRYLLNSVSESRLFFIRKISFRFSRMGSTNLMEKLASKFSAKDVSHLGFAIKLGIADYFANDGDAESANHIAKQAVDFVSSPSLIHMCMDFGVIPETPTNYANSPKIIDIAIEKDNKFPEIIKIREWISSISLLAHTKDYYEIFKHEEKRIEGQGWYRCWLRYVLYLSKAEALNRSSLPYDIKSVFSKLAKDVRPFVGEPRACDLFRLHGVIEESLSNGLKLLRTIDEWEYALDIIVKVSRETGTRLDREDGGPVPIGTVIDLLLPYATNDVAGEKIYSVIVDLVRFSDAMGTYYSTHAEHTMRLASVQTTFGYIEEAKKSWKLAGIYLTGYGWRKDATLFDIIESIPAIAKFSRTNALKALEKLQPLVASVLRHTDGRTTNHSPNSWFNSLLSVDPPSAIEILARTILENDCIENWPTIDALKSIANFAHDKADPVVVDALWETIPFKVEYQNEGENVANERLAPTGLLFEIEPEIALDRLNRLLAEAANDATRYNYDSVKRIKQFASKYGHIIDCNMSPPSNENSSKNLVPAEQGKFKFSYKIKISPFPKNPSFIDIIAGLRRASNQSMDETKKTSTNINLFLSYKLEEMVGDKDETRARRILYFIARELPAPFTAEIHPLGELAQFLENAGCDSLATTAYTLAYSRSRGGGGWYDFGDSSHREPLDKAISINCEQAQQILADEISYRLRNTIYGLGISKGLISRIAEWGHTDTAIKCWEEAFEVISYRLPLSRPNSWFASFSANSLSSWTLNEGLVALLLIRLSEPRITRKVSSIYGFMRVMRHCPNSVAKPTDWWLCRDTPISSLLIIFQMLLALEEFPYAITSYLKNTLINYSLSKCWGVALLSSEMLARANIKFPANKMYSNDPGRYPKVTNKNVKSILKYDIGNSIKKLSKIDPEILVNVYRDFYPLLDNERTLERIRERLKLAYGRDGKGYPPTNVLHWQFELFLSVMHEQACGIKDKLWSRGMWAKGKEISLLTAIQPDILLHMALFNSRIPRPSWEKPSELVSGESEPPIVKDNSIYNGWVCLGRVEDQFVTREHSFSRPTKHIQIFSGASVAPFSTFCPDNYFPFIDGNYRDWWNIEIVKLYRRPYDRWTQLLSLTRNTDWLGNDLIIIPPKELFALTDIQPPDFGEKLVWKNNRGEPILVNRYWNVRSQQFDVESDKLRGADLIIRPDIFDQLTNFFASSIKIYTQKSENDIPG